MVIKTSGADTLGQLNVMDFTYHRCLSVPRHVDDGEDEMFYLLEGELQGMYDDDGWRAVPGTFVFVPRDRPHSLAVISAAAVRGLVITGPAVLDQSIAANGVQVAHRPRDAQRQPFVREILRSRRYCRRSSQEPSRVQRQPRSRLRHPRNATLQSPCR